MKRTIIGAAVVALFTTGMVSTGHAWFFKVRSSVDTGPKAGRDLTSNSNNRVTTNQNDNRSWTDSRSTVDSRNLSDNRQTTTIDSRDLSDRSVRVDNQRHQSHDVGGAFFNKDVTVRTGHDTVNFGPISGGSGNVMDASINGNSLNIGGSAGK